MIYRNLEHVCGVIQERGSRIWQLPIELSLIPYRVDTI
jgi:hypothetical protein